MGWNRSSVLLMLTSIVMCSYSYNIDANIVFLKAALSKFYTNKLLPIRVIKDIL